MRRISGTVLILGIYSALVLALGLLRLKSSADEGGDGALAETVVMIATTIGPAWLTEWLLKRWRPAPRVTPAVSSAAHQLFAILPTIARARP